MAPAAMDPVGSVNCELPGKFAIATGAVIDALVAVSEMASKRSFHAKMKTRIAAVTIPGAASGTPRAAMSNKRSSIQLLRTVMLVVSRVSATAESSVFG